MRSKKIHDTVELIKHVNDTPGVDLIAYRCETLDIAEKEPVKCKTKRVLGKLYPFLAKPENVFI